MIRSKLVFRPLFSLGSSMKRNWNSSADWAACFAALAGCAAPVVAPADRPTQAVAVSPAASVAAEDSIPALETETIEDRFERIAEAVPGFGGFIIENGLPVILLTDTTAAAAAIGAARTEFSAVAVSRTSTQVRRVDYSFRQLRQWRQRLYQRPLPRGLVLVDIDERANRLRLDFEKDSDLSHGRDQIAELGIPPAAVDVRLAAAISPAQGGSIQGAVLPRIGAIQIGGPPGLLSSCTLGFNAKKYNDPANYFVTNAHCTGSIGVNASVPFGQPLLQVPVGVEFLDPPYTTFLGCPVINGCRYADAALIKYNAGVAVGIYRIAQTTFAYNGYDPSQSGSTVMAATSLEVTGNVPSSQLSYGYFINKIGVTSGWTTGYISATCVDQIFSDGTARLCQEQAFLVCRPGDSGSPVFVYDTGIPGTGQLAQLVGILHSCGADLAGNPVAIFSPINGVLSDLGALKTFKPVY